MIIADVMVRFSTIDVILHDKVPCGATGLKVRFQFLDPAWNPMKKIAVFRNRSQTLDVEIVEDCATIPHELLVKVRDTLDVGVYGTDSEQTLGIPTLWGSLGLVESAADPSGDPAMDPTLPYWALIKEQVDMLENTILGNDDPDSVRVSALRTSGGEMSGNIDMNGNMVTGLGTPADNTDAVSLGYANEHYRHSTWLPTADEISAAPGGFGLGTNAKVVTDLNDARACGYYCGYDAANSPLGHLVMVEVSSHQTTSWLKQSLWYIDSGNEWHTMCVRYLKSGVWTEWEWVNPPMALGVEYRTTERWQGKVVYTMLFDIGAMPASKAAKQVSLPDGLNPGQIIRCEGSCAADVAETFPAYNEGAIIFFARQDNVRCENWSSWNMSYFGAKVQIWYTKN